ncbi:MAG: hypothetical protein ACOX8P_05430 [Tepidanaerobacteraceae bacterium]|jgi:hypothetical protein
MDTSLNSINSEAVQSHLGITQSIIQRMATNSASSKAWCITIVSAILVIIAEKGKPKYAYIAIIPTILFLILDAYYLALEKAFRHSYNDFIDKLHNGTVVGKDLYVISPKGNLFLTFLKAICSFSVWPFYITLIVVIWLFKSIIF